MVKNSPAILRTRADVQLDAVNRGSGWSSRRAVPPGCGAAGIGVDRSPGWDANSLGV